MTLWAVTAAVLGAMTASPSAHTAEEKPAVQAPGLVAQIKVLPDKAPDCSSLKTMVDSITRECKTNDEKAIAIYYFMQLTHYRSGSDDGWTVRFNPAKDKPAELEISTNADN